MSINPYESPLSSPDADGSATAETRPFKLYSPGHVAWATFLGSPLAGFILLAINYARLREPQATLWSVIGGFAATAAIVPVSFFLPEDFPGIVFLAAITFGMWQMSKFLQGHRFERHLAGGGEMASAWDATGIGVLTAILLAAALLFVAFNLPEAWFPE